MMGPRTRRASIRVVTVALGAGLAGACPVAESTEEAPVAGVGEALPAIGLAGDRPALVWVLAAKQCLGCELGEPARVVRLLQRRFGERFETVVVAIGDGGWEDREVVSAFLASQRISARVEPRTVERYLREFGTGPPSVLYLANRQAVIEAAAAPDSARSWGSPDGRRGLAGLVEHILNEGVASSGEGSGKRH